MQEKQTTAQYSCTTTMTAIYSNSFLYNIYWNKKKNLMHHRSGNCHSWSQRFHPAQKRECSKNSTCESHLGAEKRRPLTYLSIRTITHSRDNFSYISPVNNLTTRNCPDAYFPIYGTTDEVIFIHRIKLDAGNLITWSTETTQLEYKQIISALIDNYQDKMYWRKTSMQKSTP